MEYEDLHYKVKADQSAATLRSLKNGGFVFYN